MTELREDIITAFDTRLTAITVANGYLNTVATVTDEYRDVSRVNPDTEMPFIAILPGVERYRDQSGGYVHVTWTINLAVYIKPASATGASMRAALSNITKDIKKALYTSPNNLGVTGVIGFRMVSRQGSEGLQELAIEQRATTVIETEVRWQEDADG